MESYGFEIEFCTHDNTMLRYTHVTIAQGTITGVGVLSGIPMKLETDSSDVLELVTPPFLFYNSKQAKEYKKKISEYLVKSVRDAVTLDKWLNTHWKQEGLVKFLHDEYENIISPKDSPSAMEEEIPEWEWKSDEISIIEVRKEINVNNIDDGINIAAANYLKNTITSMDALKQITILVPSMKDYPEGCSTQTSLPMTAEDYTRYMVDTKYLKAEARLKVIIKQSILKEPQFKEMSWSKVNRWLTSWCWHNITLLALELIAFKRRKKLSSTFSVSTKLDDILKELNEAKPIDSKTLDRINLGIKNITPENAALCDGEMTHNEIVITYICVQKIISGALGALSEKAQLNSQIKADKLQTTCCMDPKDLVQQADEDVWKDYHSSLKDLTGIWFKGWLQDVATIYQNEARDLKEPLTLLNKDKWYSILRVHWYLLDEINNHYRYRTYPEYSLLEKKDLKLLAEKLADVTTKTARMLEKTPDFNPRVYDGHQFLNYDAINFPWEGRKDTLAAPIENTLAPPRTTVAFLVEHRNN